MNPTHVANQQEGLSHPVEHGTGYGLYWRTWLWLLVITLLELGAVSVALPRAVLVGVLVLLSVMKAVLIMAHFMHLRFERLSFVYAVLTPLIFVLILFAGVVPDAVARLT